MIGYGLFHHFYFSQGNAMTTNARLTMEAVAALIVIPGDGSDKDTKRLHAIEDGMATLTADTAEERIIISVCKGVIAMAINTLNARETYARLRAKQTNGKPQQGKIYRLTGSSDEASIGRGDPLEDCEVPE